MAARYIYRCAGGRRQSSLRSFAIFRCKLTCAPCTHTQKWVLQRGGCTVVWPNPTSFQCPAGACVHRHPGLGGQPSCAHGDPQGDSDVLAGEGQVGRAVPPRHLAGTAPLAPSPSVPNVCVFSVPVGGDWPKLLCFSCRFSLWSPFNFFVCHQVLFWTSPSPSLPLLPSLPPSTYLLCVSAACFLSC